MAEPRADPLSNSSSGSERVHERTKEEFDEAKRNPHHHHHKETHGLRDDIDEETPITDVKATNVFERAKEEIEAIVQAIHPKKEHKAENHAEDRHSAVKVESTKSGGSDSHSVVNSLAIEKNIKSPNLIEKAKEDIEALIHKKKAHRHHKETHGTSDDIDEDTPISEVKGPNVFERVKEEVDALLQSIHVKKDSGSDISSAKKEGGFKKSIGKGLEKMCSPRSHNKD